MNNQSKVSICIPTYNRSDILPVAVRSAINQTYKNIEIIISDNNSSSEHWIINQKLTTYDHRIHLNRNSVNLGFAGNLNECIKIAKGDFIIFLCDDDELLPTIIEKEVGLFNTFPDLGLVHSDGFDCSIMENRRNVNYPKILNAGDDAVRKIFLEMTIFFSSVMVKRKCYEELGLFMNSFSPDWEMWARIGSKHAIGFVNEPLVKCNSHEVSHRDPKEFLHDWNYSKDKILTYFNVADKNRLEIEYKNILGKTFFNLGYQASKESSFKLGIKYFATGFPYISLFDFLKRVLIIIIKLPIVMLKNQLIPKVSRQTHV